ncbi:unnamed protein product [Adineta steineri]|uniref:Ubiquitin-like domain-containing protein n=2 Tax=Adineta steineri TaxID=433720 RepID=A0A813WL20_9BILA|nr:unnamed protein product [Adineta steineri]CAF3845372.1 unnamed protein product [Adineta steineri]
MSLTGRVSQIKITGPQNPDILQYSNAKLQLMKNDSKLIIMLPPDNEIAYECYLNDCSYLEESSAPGTVECIHDRSKQDKWIIIDKQKGAVELLNYMRDYLQNRPPEPEAIPEPESDENVKQFIRALNDNKPDIASQIARLLAQNKTSIRLGLDIINESGNAPPAPPPEPVEKPLKLKLSIESYLINLCTDEQFEVTILPRTTINDLKQIVQTNVDIPSNNQFWYINREHLPDNYEFGVTMPRVNENTLLFLYISKPQNT